MTHTSLDEFIDWITQLCNTVFRISETVPLELRWGMDPRSDDLEEEAMKDVDPTDPIEPLTFGLTLLPVNIHQITSLSGFWTALRRVADLDPAHRQLLFYNLLASRDLALQRATQLALFQQLCEQQDDYALTVFAIRHAALEARMDLRRAELSMIAFQLKIGVTEFHAKDKNMVFLLAATLFKIRVYHFDMATSYLQMLDENGKKKLRLPKFAAFHNGSFRGALQAQLPARTDSIPSLIKSIVTQLDFLTGFYEQGLCAAYKTESGRYLWDEKELGTMVLLHDLAIRVFDRLLRCL